MQAVYTNFHEIYIFVFIYGLHYRLHWLCYTSGIKRKGSALDESSINSIAKLAWRE